MNYNYALETPAMKNTRVVPKICLQDLFLQEQSLFEDNTLYTVFDGGHLISPRSCLDD